MTLKYEYRKDGKYLVECAACGCEAPLAELDHPDVRKRGEKVLMCEVCACTGCGYPLLTYKDDSGLFRAMAQIANLLLDKLDKGRR